MKPVDQTSFGWTGNCFSACIASILELPIEAVPQMMTLEGINDTDGCSGWWERFCKWCDANNVDVKYIGDRLAEAPAGYCIKTGRSPRNPDRFHAVVALDGVVVHDPHACDRRGVTDHLDFITVEYRK